MEDQENEEFLPAGWRVETRVKKNGKKDKVLIEKVAAEGLPPGWIKEIRVTKTAHKVRKDPVYIDPVSGYFFRSMKDAVRYLETGEIGRLAYKPKDKGSHDEDLEDDKYDKLEITGAELPITGQSTKSSEIPEDEDAPNSASAGEHICVTEYAYDRSGPGIALSSSDLPETKVSNKTDGGKGSDECAPLSISAVGVLPDGQSSESGEVKNETKKTGLGKCRSRKQKVLDLPRRASKRLAGLALDPTPELKTSNRTRRAVVKQSDEIVSSMIEASCSGSLTHQGSQQPNELEAQPKSNHVFDTSKSTVDSLESSKSRHYSQDPNEYAGKTETDCKSDKKQGCDVVLPQRNEYKVETDSNADAKQGTDLDLPLGDLLSDPCIAFAIKTLTGATFDTSNDTEVSLGSKNSTFDGLATSEEHSEKLKTENEAVEKQKNLPITKEHAVNVESSFNMDEKLGLPHDLPFADIWRDPCIEFAIKTLTSTNPVGYDLDIQDYFQQQLNSSQTQANNNFCQTEFLCQQYDVLEKHVSREQTRTGNLRIQNSAETGLHQHGEKRCNECH